MGSLISHWVVVLLAPATSAPLPDGIIATRWHLDAPRFESDPTLLPPECLEGGGDPDEIIVCSTRPKRERYRLPPQPDGFDPNGPVDSAWRRTARLHELGEAGIGSCSTIGPGGYTGCLERSFRHHMQQHLGN